MCHPVDMCNKQLYKGVALAWNIVADRADRPVPGLSVYGNVGVFVGAVVAIVDLWSER